METQEIRKKDIIQYYQNKRLFLFLDEWGFYFLLVYMHMQSLSALLILPIMIYGGIALYTSYKNISLIESKILDINQEIYAYKDLYALYKWAHPFLQHNLSQRIQLSNPNVKQVPQPQVPQPQVPQEVVNPSTPDPSLESIAARTSESEASQ
jgi:hypothetical protein